MKTKKLAEFKNGAAKITVVMNFCTADEFAQHKLYCVTETPIHKNAKWSETKKEFDYTKEWQKYFKECVNYWLKK